jgi:hypothetical protein
VPHLVSISSPNSKSSNPSQNLSSLTSNHQSSDHNLSIYNDYNSTLVAQQTESSDNLSPIETPSRIPSHRHSLRESASFRANFKHYSSYDYRPTLYRSSYPIGKHSSEEDYDVETQEPYFMQQRLAMTDERNTDHQPSFNSPTMPTIDPKRQSYYPTVSNPYHAYDSQSTPTSLIQTIPSCHILHPTNTDIAYRLPTTSNQFPTITMTNDVSELSDFTSTN